MIRAAHRTAMASFQLPVGLLAERIGERNLLAAGTALAGLAFVALGLASGFWMLLIALFFAGVGSAVQHPLCSTIISHAYPESGRRAALGTYNLFGDVGKFAFGGILSLCLMLSIPWQGPVITYGIGVVLISGFILVWIVNSRTNRRTSPSMLSTELEPACKIRGWGIRHRKGFVALCAIEILDSSTRVGFLTLVAFLMLYKGIPKGWATLSVPLILAGGMAGKYFCGLLAERVGIIRTIIITEILTAAGIFLAAWLPAWGAFLLLPMLGVVLQGTSSVLYATIGDLVHEDRLPRAFGLFYTLGSLCGIAAPLGFGLAGDLLGIRVAVIIMATGVMLAIPLCFILRQSINTEPVKT
jgi:FSR family fosmidomycin resistance protein-like MFS transporter